MEKTIIGSGVYVLDTIVVREYPAWPQPRPFVDRTVIEEIGGTCGNVMCMLSWLGWKAMPQVMLDDSPEGLKMTDDLKHYGCDCRFVTNTPEGGTTLLRCTHKKDAEGNHTITFRATGPGGSRFPKRHYLRARDEAPAFLAGLEEAPGVYFFDDPAAGHRLIARTLRERGSIVYFEPSVLVANVDFDAVVASDIVKFSGAHVTDLSFTDRFPDKLFIQTLGEDGLRFRLRGGRWVSVPPERCWNVVDWEGAGDWTTSAFLTQLAALDVPFSELDEYDVQRCLDAAQTVAAQSVCFLSSKGLIHEAVRMESVELYELMNRKDIRSNFSDRPVQFAKELPDLETAAPGAYSDGIMLLDLVADSEDDISQMHGILRSGSPINLQDFYEQYGAFEDGNRFKRMATALLADRLP